MDRRARIIDFALANQERINQFDKNDPKKSYLLVQRQRMPPRNDGFLFLHASAIEENNRAIAFLGGKRWGKSTIATSLLVRGARLVTDDILKVEEILRMPIARYGDPLMKLWSSTLSRLLKVDPSSFPRIHPAFDKRILLTDVNRKDASIPFGHMYVLRRGKALSIKKLTRQEAFIELVRHTYSVGEMPRVEREHHFVQCATMATKVPVYRLTVPYGLNRLPSAVTTLRKHISSVSRKPVQYIV